MRLLSFDTPPPPTTTKEDDLSALRLIRSRRVGPATYHRLIAEYGSAEAALDALPGIAAAAGIEGYQLCPEGVIRAEMAAGHRAGGRLITIGSPHYPALLREIPDAPPVLWVKGNIALLDAPSVAVIGSRNASSLGLRMARGLARAMAEAGLAVAAGLARGVDTAAHEASCDRGTIAVMAGGIDVIYPAENKALAERICEAGCLITECAPGVEPVARHFPARNRLVSGLSAGVVVIEAAHRSGTLITARLAAEQGREVMAVPGHPIDARASSCNALIRDGATLVRNVDDILAAIGRSGRAGDGGGARDGGDAGEAGQPEEPRQRGNLKVKAAASGYWPGRANGEPPITQRRRAVDAATHDRSRSGPRRDDGPQSGNDPRPHNRSASVDHPADGARGPHPLQRPGEHAPSGPSASYRAPGESAANMQSNANTRAAEQTQLTAQPYRDATRADTPVSSNDHRSQSLADRIINLIGPSPTEEDQVIRDLDTTAAKFAAAILELELDGRVIRMPGGRVALL